MALFSRDGERIAITEGDDMRVCDVQTGQPLTDPVHLPRPCLTDWSPDGRFLQTITGNDSNRTIRILSVPPPLPEGTPIPPWLLQLASVCATKTINDAEQCVDAPEVIAQISDVRRQLAALPDNAPYVEWGRWFLDDSPTRSIAPGFTITPAEADTLEVPDRSARKNSRGYPNTVENTAGAQACPFDKLRASSLPRGCVHFGGRDQPALEANSHD
jgi:hypothetical protein